MFSATLRRRAEASMWSKSTLVSWDGTDTLQYKSSSNISNLTIALGLEIYWICLWQSRLDKCLFNCWQEQSWVPSHFFHRKSSVDLVAQVQWAPWSCYKCGLHKPRSLGSFRKLAGQNMFCCSDCNHPKWLTPVNFLHEIFTVLMLIVLCMSSAFSQRIYGSSGRQIGRAEGLRRMQLIIYFYFFT